MPINMKVTADMLRPLAVFAMAGVGVLLAWPPPGTVLARGQAPAAQLGVVVQRLTCVLGRRLGVTGFCRAM